MSDLLTELVPGVIELRVSHDGLQDDWIRKVAQNASNVKKFTKCLDIHVVPSMLQKPAETGPLEVLGPYCQYINAPLTPAKIILSGLGGPSLTGSWMFEVIKPVEVEWRKGGMSIPFNWVVDEIERPTIHNPVDVEVITFNDVEPPDPLHTRNFLPTYTKKASLSKSIHPRLRQVKINLGDGVGQDFFWKFTEEWWDILQDNNRLRHPISKRLPSNDLRRERSWKAQWKLKMIVREQDLGNEYK